MSTRFKARCMRVRVNNGIVEVLLTKRSDGRTEEQHVLMNVVAGDEPYEEGLEYWIDVQPAFPH